MGYDPLGYLGKLKSTLNLSFSFANVFCVEGNIDEGGDAVQSRDFILDIFFFKCRIDN